MWPESCLLQHLKGQKNKLQFSKSLHFRQSVKMKEEMFVWRLGVFFVFCFFFRTGSMVDFGDCTASWISVCITQCLASWTRKRTKIQCNSVKNKTKQTHLLLHRGVNMHSCFLMRYRSLILSHFYSCGSSVPPDWPNPSRCSTSAVAGWSHLDTLKISQNSSLLQWMISPRCCRFVLKNCCWNHKESKNK